MRAAAAPGGGVGGRQGRRLRPRCRRGQPGRARRRVRRTVRGADRRRVSRSANAGIDAPILVLSEQPADDAATIVANRLTPPSTTVAGVDALGRRPARDDRRRARQGRHRDAPRRCRAGRRAGARRGHRRGRAAAASGGDLHPPRRRRRAGDPYTAGQLAPLRRGARGAARPAHGVAVHAANSAGAPGPCRRSAVVRPCRHRHLRHLARSGVDDLAADLRPVLSLRARVSFVKRLAGGRGCRTACATDSTADTTVATRADRLRRRRRARLSSSGEVLIGGRRRPIVGMVTMDQLMVDCGDDPVQRGDEVVLIGTPGRTSRSRPRSGPIAAGHDRLRGALRDRSASRRDTSVARRP